MRSLPLPGEPAETQRSRTRWAGVAESLRRAIARGTRQAGELLPSTRELAAHFGVHRQTVMVALDALCAEGLLRAEPRRGYRVAGPEQGALARPRALPRAEDRPYPFRILRPLPRRRPELGQVTHPLHSATPDPALLPLAELRSAYTRALRRSALRALDTADEWGHPALREQLLGYLRRARALCPARLLLTSGSQEGIALVAHTLLGPGDAVAVEDPGYFPAWEAFGATGAELVPIPVDEHGLRIDALGSALSRRRIRLVYVTPHHQFPTTVTLTAPRRRALLELTRTHGVPILEDDYDHEYQFRRAPRAPLASSRAPHVLYVASLSKLVAPGIRVGLLCGGADIIGALAERRRASTRCGDGVTEAALADWIADGGFERHVRRARRAYAERREAALDTLARAAARVPLEFHAPDGGLAIWTRWPEHSTLELGRRALSRGVSTLPSNVASLSGADHGLRLAFGRVAPATFAEGVDTLVEEALALRPRRRSKAGKP